MQILISILGILITILFVVGTHEFAHFIVARMLNVKVLRFSIGFGKTLFRWQGKSGTEYIFALIPLGGYVQMLDETEGAVAPEEKHLAYNQQPFYKKFLIVLAGPSMNILCALLLYWIIFMVGFVTIKPVIGDITPNSIAAKAGLQKNQEIIRVDHSPTSNWMSIIFRALMQTGNTTNLAMDTSDLAGKKIQSHLLDLTHWQMDNLNPEPLKSLGIAPYEPEIPLIVGIIDPASPAANSPLKVGDKIFAVNRITINNWMELTNLIQAHPAEDIALVIERHGKFQEITVKTGYKYTILLQKKGQLGIGPQFKLPPELLRTVQYPPLEALSQAWREIYDFTYFNLILFGKLFTGKLSLQSLGGPITIFESAGEALNYGLLPFLGFLAFLSIAIGVINFLPIPGLDGGHLFIQFIEFIIRRPIPEKALMMLYRIGIFLIIFVFIQAVANDILRLY